MRAFNEFVRARVCVLESVKCAEKCAQAPEEGPTCATCDHIANAQARHECLHSSYIICTQTQTDTQSRRRVGVGRERVS